MSRPPTLLVAIAVHALVVAALAVGAFLYLGVSGLGALGAIIVFLGLLLAALVGIGLVGLMGLWRGTERGYHVALWTQLALALVFLGLGIDAMQKGPPGAPPDWNAFLPAGAGLALLATSAALLLTPSARDACGLLPLAMLDPDEDPPLPVRGIVAALVLVALAMNVALQALALAVSLVFGLLTLELDVLGILFETEYFLGIVLFLAPAVAGAIATWRERRWGWWALVVAHAGGALFFVFAAQSAWGRRFDPMDLVVPAAGGVVLLASALLLALPSTREWASL